MIEIHLLEQLAAFAETGTLSAAAEKLHTSQPALTRSMKRLEEELNADLFVRGKNSLKLTETGQKAAEYARYVLEADRDFERKVRAFERSQHTLSIGFCAPVPQAILTPIINSLFDGMTVSADMMDDAHFLDRLLNGEYHLAVTHQAPKSEAFFYKKCGHEALYINVTPGDPLTFYPEVHLSDLDGRSILLFSRIGFWANIQRNKTPNTRFLLQVERDSFSELAVNSDYPTFTSSYYLSRGENVPGKVSIPIVDKECQTDYFLACLMEKRQKYKKLFDRVDEHTVE